MPKSALHLGQQFPSFKNNAIQAVVAFCLNAVVLTLYKVYSIPNGAADENGIIRYLRIEIDFSVKPIYHQVERINHYINSCISIGQVDKSISKFTHITR